MVFHMLELEARPYPSLPGDRTLCAQDGSFLPLVSSYSHKIYTLCKISLSGDSGGPCFYPDLKIMATDGF